MRRWFSILAGVTLILLGVVSLAVTLVAPLLGASVWAWAAWRLWPLAVVAAGLLLAVWPLFVRDKRGLGALFIPGAPVLATGAILLYASVLDAWQAWEWLWPLEVIALAAGFLLAAVYMRAMWLLLPAVVIGVNGLMFQFCALTGRWDLWAILWTVEPLSVGLAFLIINLKQRSPGLFVVGLVLCVVAALGLMGMTVVFPGWVLINALGPGILLFAGVLMLVHSLVRRPAPPEAVPE